MAEAEGTERRRHASELIEVIEPYAFGLLNLRPEELWHYTPAEVAAMLSAKIKPAELLTKRRETEIEENMTPEQIGQQLRLMAAAYKERQ
jgi:hypothetical protein